MSKQPGSHNTPRAVVEEILRLHIEEGYSYRQLAEKFQKPFKTIQNILHNEYKKQRQLLECGKVPRSASTFLNPTTEQYLALQRENRQLRMENELLRGFHRSQEKR